MDVVDMGCYWLSMWGERIGLYADMLSHTLASALRRATHLCGRCEFAALERSDFSQITVRYPEELMHMKKLADYRTCRSLCQPILHNNRLLAGISDEYLTIFLGRFRFRTFADGEVVCQQGEICHAWLFLGVGKVERSKAHPKSEE